MSEAGLFTKTCTSGITPDEEICNGIAKNLGVVPSSEILEWAPLDIMTSPEVPPQDPFNNFQDVIDPSMTADLGFLTASNEESLDKSLVSDQGFPDDSELTDVFMGAPYESAAILNDDFYDDTDFDDRDPLEFGDTLEFGDIGGEIGGCRNSVSSFSSRLFFGF